VTISVGGATLDEAGAAALLARADAALYASKQGGRNRVTMDSR
jgi:PleD family two-component response regulator